MLPHHHFIIAGLAVAPVAMITPDKAGEILPWILAGGLASMAMDLDVVILVLLGSRQEMLLRPYRNVWRIFTEFERFKTVLVQTGLQKTACLTHLATAACLPLAVYFLWPAYFVPVALGVASHMISDIPNIKRVKDCDEG